MTTNSILTDEQQAIVDDVQVFLNPDNTDKFFLISAPAGTGKTFLAKYIYTDVYCKNSYKYDFIFTATTHKAVSVLEASLHDCDVNISTIHSFLGLRVKNDYNTGETIIAPEKNVVVKRNFIIVVDECSMISKVLFKWINSLTLNCKIIFIGDDKQLPPVGDTISPVFSMGIPIHTLTKVIRSDAHEEITNICTQLRSTVETLEFKDLFISGNIHHCSNVEFEQVVKEHFSINCPDYKILTYTNKKCIAYNEYISKLRGQKEFITEGNFYICNTPILYTNIPEISRNTFRNYKSRPRCVWNNEEIQLNSILGIQEDDSTGLQYYECTYSTFYVNAQGKWVLSAPHPEVLKVPVHYEELSNALTLLASQRRWKEYFRIKETFADLRYRDASTVHKAQGATLNKVFIDLTDLGSCKQHTVFSRLLYVAMSRAKDEIYLVGELPLRYGRVISQEDIPSISIS